MAIISTPIENNKKICWKKSEPFEKKDKPKLNVSRFNGHGNTRQQKEMNDNN